MDSSDSCDYKELPIVVRILTHDITVEYRNGNRKHLFICVFVYVRTHANTCNRLLQVYDKSYFTLIVENSLILISKSGSF